MPRAILSVSDKTGLVEFARTLSGLGWDMIASGGTAAALTEAGLNVTPVDVVTGTPEILGGRVKTLHPAVHGGILARANETDQQELLAHGFAPISMVVCNLYPFEETIQAADVSLAEAIEQIDIGGVTLLRAGAKNFEQVTVLCNPADYTRIGAMLRASGEIDRETRLNLAVKAFAHTRHYDTAIHTYLVDQVPAADETTADPLPEAMALGLVQAQKLRYGENPHQQAAFYATQPATLPLLGELLGGKALSYNNLLDLDAAWRAVESFTAPTVVIIKHQTPTGIATHKTIAQAFPAALASDRVSAFGGVIAVNRTVDETFVTELSDLFVEAIAAPDFTPEAITALQKSRKNCRLVKMQPDTAPRRWQMRTIRGGYLAQTLDEGDPPETAWRVVTRWKPSDQEMKTLRFAWQAVQHVPSNAIVLAKPGATIGVGGGLPSRVDAAKLAIEKAGARIKEAVMASDAFFPFPDVIELAQSVGVTAIIQPGGSIRDAAVIEAADSAGIAMVFSGVRHFRH